MQIRWPLVAIDPDHVIPFAPPGALEVGDTQIAAKIMAASGGVEDDIVVRPGAPFFVGNIHLRHIDRNFMAPASEWILTAELCVEIELVGRQWLIKGFIIDVEVLAMLFIWRFIDQLDQGMFPEGHGCITVEGTTLVHLIVAVCGCGKKQRLE
ncbi:MAG: hypothetical protein UZ16_OP3001001573 [Candidatus Hinthialibacteria bacterium OLB16]|nr:MAG: hypothetical protein UZ16_OP3001001573 [Candidatus Hinthialibacteria bacterium OLB16]